jgi:outer membrane cobalamin receptor
MNTRAQFKKKLIATVIASTVVTGFSGYAVAQDDVEEVVVTGIRASLEKSADVKRDSAGVVDSINSEDMGKFPDTNLAESLQRITGVSISRSNGEGSEVTVRGFGGDNNMVTLNGRMMPAANTYGGGSGAGGTRGGATRAFDFANLASESVSAVEVYKTSKANIATGGIGATINTLAEASKYYHLQQVLRIYLQNLYLLASTHYSVSAQTFHYSVSPSLIQQVLEY